ISTKAAISINSLRTIACPLFLRSFIPFSPFRLFCFSFFFSPAKYFVSGQFLCFYHIIFQTPAQE
ncbi:MAG: hypothetical protein KBG87_05130, partial [Lachnospiraceae bacterium]|nr:hypothetical protein [Lachnospiraceae bacterium]